LEYSKTTTAEESKRTKILRLRNFIFFKNIKELPHDHPELHLADYVNITFDYQKNDERNESAGMFRATNDGLLRPVRIWAATVRRVRSHSGADDVENRKVNLFKNDKRKIFQITYTQIRTKLRAAARVKG
jgi:hypothetical protein